MKMQDCLYVNWHKALREARHPSLRQYLSPAIYAQYDVGVKIMRQYVYGKLIDLGCGDMPFKGFLLGLVDTYDSLDLWPNSEVTYVGDIQNMSMIDANIYDSALCLEVLEHVPNPHQAIKEIYRILKPSGVLIISVPHLSRIHNAPYDYCRFTLYGLMHLLNSAGFSVITIQTKGGIFSFIGHQVSVFLVGICWRVPVLRQIVLALIKYCVTLPCYKLDQLVDFGGSFALGYIAVARK